MQVVVGPLRPPTGPEVPPVKTVYTENLEEKKATDFCQGEGNPGCYVYLLGDGELDPKGRPALRKGSDTLRK